MSVNPTVLFVIIGCAIVTLIPRVAPFLIVRTVKLPKPVMKWLSFIPVCILSALVVGSVIEREPGQFPSLNIEILITLLPTLLLAIWTKSLLVTVIAGVVLMAFVRTLM
ncbi:AzlD domain-containing protein [Bacillus sp. FJAT-52991]|uniref:AzlD domain-containing protein n=1 Tax=Bacillus kandeliae TaxID=3129297 RepID=A0ABZ2NBM8_9BACI